MSTINLHRTSGNNPDVSGWPVVDKNGEKLGKVECLLADDAQNKERYIDVNPESELLASDQKVYSETSDSSHQYRDRDGDVHMVLPIGMAHIDEQNHKVVADRVEREQFTQSPMISKKDEVTAGYEGEVQRYYSASEKADSANMYRTHKAEHHTKGNENISVRQYPEGEAPEHEYPDAEKGAEKPGKIESSGKSKRDTISSPGRSNIPGSGSSHRMTKGAPDSLEADATSAGAQAGSISPRKREGMIEGSAFDRSSMYHHDAYNPDHFYNRI